MWGTGFALAVGGCGLSDLADKLAADFEAGVKERAAEAQRQAQARIGEQGGEVKAYNGAVSVPEGALEGDTMIAIAEMPPASIRAELPGVLAPVTPPMAFTPHGTTFTEPVTLSLFYDESMQSDDLSVLRLDDGGDTSWERVDDSEVMMNDGVALVSTAHFSVYTVVLCKDLPGKLAGVCADFKNGDISLKDLETLAPPLKDAWAGVDIADPAPSGTGQREPGDLHLGCDDIQHCEAAAKECANDARSSVCDFVKACQHVFAECRGGGDLPENHGCEEFAADCKQGIRAACDAYAKQCGGSVPNGEAVHRCDELAMTCRTGDQNACAVFDRECAANEPRGCDLLAGACSQKDERACAEYSAKCGGDPAGPFLSTCDKLRLACNGGDPTACDRFKLTCVVIGELTPCDKLAITCRTGDQNACAVFDRECAANEPSGCDFLAQACSQKDERACAEYSAKCGGDPLNPGLNTCDQLLLDCKNNNPVACDTFKAECGVTGELNPCDKLALACKEGDQQACTVFPSECAANAPTVCSDRASMAGTLATKGYPGQEGALAFDHGTETFASLYSEANVTYLGQDFSTPLVIRLIRLQGTSSFGIGAVLQYSDDGTAWRDTNVVAKVPPGDAIGVQYDVDGYGAHRYWRLLDRGYYQYMQIDTFELLTCD